MAVTNKQVICDRCFVSYSFDEVGVGRYRPIDFVISRSGCLCVRCAPPKPARKPKKEVRR